MYEGRKLTYLLNHLSLEQLKILADRLKERALNVIDGKDWKYKKSTLTSLEYCSLEDDRIYILTRIRYAIENLSNLQFRIGMSSSYDPEIKAHAASKRSFAELFTIFSIIKETGNLQNIDLDSIDFDNINLEEHQRKNNDENSEKT